MIFNIAKEDILRLRKKQFEATNQSIVIWAIRLVITFGFVFIGLKAYDDFNNFTGAYYMILAIVCFGIAILNLIFFNTIREKRYMKKTQKHIENGYYDNLLGQQSITVDEGVLSYQKQEHIVNYTEPFIKICDEKDDFLRVGVSNESAYMIPLTSFKSKNEKKHFLEMIAPFMCE